MNIRYTPEQRKFVADNYGQMSATEIGIKLGLTNTNICGLAARMGKKLPQAKRREILSINGRKNIWKINKIKVFNKINVVSKFPGASIDVIVFLAYEKWIKRRRIPTLSEVLQEICCIFEIPIDDVKGKRRYSNIMQCRKIYCFVGSVKCHKTLSSIGALIGKDYTSVIHLRDSVIDNLQVNDPAWMPVWQKYLSETKLFV